MKASDSSRFERYMEGFGRWLTVLNPVSENSQRQDFGGPYGLGASGSVGHHTRQLDDFAEPPAVVLALNVDRQVHIFLIYATNTAL
jgi:hypothetical protein